MASNTPALQPGLRTKRTSKSSPVIVIPAGASKASAAAAPAGAYPGPATLRTTIPSPEPGRATSIRPPGHAT